MVAKLIAHGDPSTLQILQNSANLPMVAKPFYIPRILQNSTSSLSVVPPPPFSGNSLSSPAKNLLASIKSLIHPFAFRFHIRFKIKNQFIIISSHCQSCSGAETGRERKRSSRERRSRDIRECRYSFLQLDLIYHPLPHNRFLLLYGTDICVVDWVQCCVIIARFWLWSNNSREDAHLIYFSSKKTVSHQEP